MRLKKWQVFNAPPPPLCKDSDKKWPRNNIHERFVVLFLHAHAPAHAFAVACDTSLKGSLSLLLTGVEPGQAHPLEFEWTFW